MRRLRVFLTLFLIGAFFSIAQAKETKVGVVVTVQGPVKVKRRVEDTARARTALRILMTVNQGDKLVIPDKSQVTISVLSSGIRYTLMGPLEDVVVPLDGVFQVDKSKLKEDRQAGREGIMAANSVDLKKMGGGSGRALGSQIYSHSGSPRLPLDVVPREIVFNAPSDVLIRYRTADAEGKPTGDWQKGAALVHHQEDGKTVVTPRTSLFAPGKIYQVVLTDENLKSGVVCDYAVYCLSPQELTALKKIEDSTRPDLSSQIELFNSYIKMKLFEKAEDKLREIQKAAPDAQNWSQVWMEFEVERRASQKGDGGNGGPSNNGNGDEPGSGPIKF